MNGFHRRSFICSGAAVAVALPAASILKGAPAYASQPANSRLVANQVQREQVWAFFRSFYSDKDNVDVSGFLTHFVQSSQDEYQDAVLNLTLSGYDEIASTLGGIDEASDYLWRWVSSGDGNSEHC